MSENRFDFLVNHFSSYQINISKDGMLAEILNPFYRENISVHYYPEDEFTPFVVSFAFQHCHMNDTEDIIEYIDDIMNGNLFSIEFFKNGARYFGGDITAEEIEALSYEVLEQYSGYYGLHKLKDLADSFKLRGWNKKDSFDAVFVTNPDGTVFIKRLD